MSGKVQLTIIKVRISITEGAGRGQVREVSVACQTLTTDRVKVLHQFLLKMQIKIQTNNNTQAIIRFTRIITKSIVIQNTTTKAQIIKILRVTLMITEEAVSHRSKTSRAWALRTHRPITEVNSTRVITSSIGSIAIMTTSGSNHLNDSLNKCHTRQVNSIMGQNATKGMKVLILAAFTILGQVSAHPIHSKVRTTPIMEARENIIMKETMVVAWISACPVNSIIKTTITGVAEEEAIAMVIVVAVVT